MIRPFLFAALLAACATPVLAEGPLGNFASDTKGQFVIPDRPSGRVFLFTCTGAGKDQIRANWDQARSLFEDRHMATATALDLETERARATGKMPSQKAIDAFNVRFLAHKSAVQDDLAPLGCKFDGLLRMR